MALIEQQKDKGKEVTKRCPFCAEEILLAANKCKHCGSVLTNNVTPPLAERGPAADYSWAILGIPLAGVVLIWTWVANMSLLQGPGSALALITAAVVISTAAVCAVEAGKLGMRRDREKGTYSPAEWGISVLVLWIISYPAYLFDRRKFGVGNRLLSGLIVVVLFIGSVLLINAAIEEKVSRLKSTLQSFTAQPPPGIASPPVLPPVSSGDIEPSAAAKPVVAKPVTHHIATWSSVKGQSAKKCAELFDAFQMQAVCMTNEKDGYDAMQGNFGMPTDIASQAKDRCEKLFDTFQLQAVCMRNEQKGYEDMKRY